MVSSEKIGKALTIAGSDSGGGAGIQADLKTFTSLKVFGTSVITALTAQNTVGVQNIHSVHTDFIGSQFDSIMSDIGTDSAKTGMLSSIDVIEKVAEKVKQHKITKLVVDPVMVATSGPKLLNDDAIATLVEKILPLAFVLTPNLPEAEILSGMSIRTLADVRLAAEKLYAITKNYVLVKGGHCPYDADENHIEEEGDILAKGKWTIDVGYDGKEFYYFKNEFIPSIHTHGSGCTLSAAIAAFLARGEDVNTAVGKAIKYVNRAIYNGFPVGKGNGPLNHFHNEIEL
jgi:hydroxymethylpyrimidine kinase/phosphomethylpyrimidine kinase